MGLIALLVVAFSGRSATQVQLRWSSFTSLYAHVRAEPRSSKWTSVGKAALKIEAAMPLKIRTRSGLERSAQDEVEKGRIREMYWQLIDSIAFTSSSALDFRSNAEVLPDIIGGFFVAGDLVVEFANELEKIEPQFEKESWPFDKDLILAETKVWTGAVDEKWTNAFNWLVGTLAIEQPPERISVMIVPRLGDKGGVTLRSLQGPLIVVGLDKFKGDNLIECIVHESLHALEASSGKIGLVEELRRGLDEAHIATEIRDDALHSIYFMTAAETVRRFYEPQHRDYIVGTKNYRIVKPVHEVMRPILEQLWDGKATRPRATADAVEALKKIKGRSSSRAPD